MVMRRTMMNFMQQESTVSFLLLTPKKPLPMKNPRASSYPLPHRSVHWTIKKIRTIK